MTAIQRVKRTQRVLVAVAISEALAYGFATTVAILALISFLPHFASRLPPSASLLGILVAILILYRSRHILSAPRVALWIEERVPALHYSLVTAAEQHGSPSVVSLEECVAREDLRPATLISLRKGVLVAAPALAAALLLLYVSPSGAFGRGGAFSGFGAFISPSAVTAASRLEGLAVRITPPAYTGARS